MWYYSAFKLPLDTVCKVAIEIYRSCLVHVYRGRICKPLLKMCRNEHCASFWYFLWAINLSWFACHRVSPSFGFTSVVVGWVDVQWYCSASSPPYAYGSSFLFDYITLPTNWGFKCLCFRTVVGVLPKVAVITPIMNAHSFQSTLKDPYSNTFMVSLLSRNLKNFN